MRASLTQIDHASGIMHSCYASMTKPSDQSYDQIDLTQEQLNAIKYILETLSKGFFETLKNQTELQKIGLLIFPVHPYKVLATMLSDKITLDDGSNLKEKFKIIYEMYCINLIRYNFFKAHILALENDFWKDTLLQDSYLNDFAKDTNQNPERLKELIEEKKWDQFFKELVES